MMALRPRARRRASAVSLYVGTVVRTAPVVAGGEIIRLDWHRGQLVARAPVRPEDPSCDHDPNPRGNTRGCRGIVVQDDHVIYVNYHTIVIADRALQVHRTISDNLFVGLHEIWLADPDHLWVTATAIDMAHLVHLPSGKVVERCAPRSNPIVARQFGLESVARDPNMDHRLAFMAENNDGNHSHLHLNAVAQIRERTVGLLNRFGAIVDLETGSVLVEDNALVGAHNLVPMVGSLALAADTRRARVLTIDLDAGHVVASLDLREFKVVRDLESKASGDVRGDRPPSAVARALFVRGLTVHGSSMFIGMSPATILEIDRDSGALVTHVQLARDPRVCVHGLAVAPLP